MLNDNRKTISIIGGSGFIGKALATSLSKNGFLVNVLTTKRINARPIWMLSNLNVFEFTNDQISISKAVQGSDIVVNLVGRLHSKKGYPWGKDFDEAHVKLVQNMVMACNDQNIKEIIHVSALGVSESAPSEYLRSKYAAEKILEKFKGKSVILRPSVVFGPGDSFLNLFAKLQKYSPIMPMALTKTQFQPIYINDLIEIILRCVNMIKKKKIDTYECVGPEIFTLYEIIKFSGIYSGRKAMVIPLPKFIGLIQAFILEKMPGPTLMSRDNIASMSIPSIATKNKELVFPLEQPTSIHKVAPKFLSKSN